MSYSFYDNSVGTYLQTLEAMVKVLERGRSYAEENGIDLQNIVQFQLQDNMLPFSFQVVSVWHHSLGALAAMKSGLFGPPEKMGELTYERLQGLLSEAVESLKSETREDVDALQGKPVVFRMGSHEMPFTTDSFLASFSLPNFYFHATTTYAILRMQGAPLGKMDFLGQMRMAPAG